MVVIDLVELGVLVRKLSVVLGGGEHTWVAVDGMLLASVLLRRMCSGFHFGGRSQQRQWHVCRWNWFERRLQ
jgi:hypothetical protein